ncbi:DUF397 domain-containing protein [Streptomyces niveus]
MDWRKSSYSSGDTGNCIEFARVSTGRIAIRDSKNKQGPTLVVPTDSWSSFVGMARSDDSASA